MKNKFIYLAIIAAGFASCEPEFENEVDANYSSGEADFTSYVAIGNSLTAGYMDGTVSRVGQTYSYPNLLAQQFALVGGGAFTQPSFAEDVNNLGGILGLTGTRLVLDANQLNPNGTRGAVEPIAGTPTITLTPQAKAYNNMGVPGAKSFHLNAPGYGSAAGLLLGRANPYFVRHATTPTATVIADAMTKNPTFFTNWIGANDVLSYATSGGTMPDNPLTTTVDESLMPANDHNVTGNINPATYGPNDITNSTLFTNVYTNIINTLTNGGAKGVVCTIPSVTSIPYFTTVKWNPVALDATRASSLNAAYTNYNNGLDLAFSNNLISNNERQARKIIFTASTNNPLVIVDNDLTNLSGLGIPSFRMTTANDLVVLPAASFIGTLVNSNQNLINGLTVPLANKWVLTANEKAKVASATNAYNASIRAIATTKNLAVADMNAIMNQLVSGLRIENGQIYTAYYFGQNPLNLLPITNPNYVSPSGTEGLVLFSLDGVHPNARGYAVITNEIIKVINAKYKSKLPLHNPSYFPGINIVASN